MYVLPKGTIHTYAFSEVSLFYDKKIRRFNFPKSTRAGTFARTYISNPAHTTPAVRRAVCRRPSPASHAAPVSGTAQSFRMSPHSRFARRPALARAPRAGQELSSPPLETHKT